MGIDRIDKIVTGYKFPYDIIHNASGEKFNIWDDDLLKYIEGHPGEQYTLSPDSMMGKYIVFGKLHARADDDGWGFTELVIDADLDAIREKTLEIFGEYKVDIGVPKTFIFTNWS